MRILENLRINKRKITITTFQEDDPGRDWLDKSPTERIAGLEALRQIWHDYDPSTARLPRVYTIVERTWR